MMSLSGSNRKVFFFEKKKQKTFVNWRIARTRDPVTEPNVQKFFASFFQKRRTSFSS